MSYKKNFRDEMDYFGFTKQTAIILEGLGIGHLIPKFVDKNISTMALSQLTIDDFITLGVDEDKANIVAKQLHSRIDRNKSNELKFSTKSQQFIDILTGSKQQLSYIQAFMAYTRLKLLQAPNDYIIDRNSNIRASEALCTVSKCAIQEISILEQKLKELSVLLSEDNTKKKSKTRILYSVSSIGVFIYLIYTWKYGFFYMKHH